MQEVLHALCDKNRKLPKRPSLSAPHGRAPPAELVTLMQQCWHQVIISLPPSAHLCTYSSADYFVLLFICSFNQALIYTLTHSFTHSLTYSLTHSLTHSLTPSPVDTVIHSSIVSSTHSCILSFVLSLMCSSAEHTHSFLGSNTYRSLQQDAI